MKSLRMGILLAAVCALATLPEALYAINGPGTGRLVSVIPLDGGCVFGPTGPFVQAWDIQPGFTYCITIANVTECANGDTDATLDVQVRGATGVIDIAAVYVSPGMYQFNVMLPEDARCTYPIFYCTAPGNSRDGYWVIRNDGLSFQAHLRASTFDGGCTNPMEIIGPECGMIGTEESSWGAIKDIYR